MEHGRGSAPLTIQYYNAQWMHARLAFKIENSIQFCVIVIIHNDK